MRKKCMAVAVCAWVLLAVALSAQERRIDQPQYRVAKEGNARVIIISFQTNFLATGASADAAATDSANNTTTIPNVATKTVENVVSPPRSRFEARISYAPPVSQAVVLQVNVRAFQPASADAAATTASGSPQATSAPAAVASISFDMQPVQDYFGLLKKTEDLHAQMVNYVLKPLPPVINADVVSVTDRSIKLRVKSPQFVRVRAYAYQTTDPTLTAGPSDLKSDDVILYDDIWREVSIANLSERTDYTIAVRESAPPADRPPSAFVVTKYQGQQIKTVEPIPRPYVAFSGPPVNKRNQELALRLTTTNVSKVRATIFNDTTADKTEIARDVEIAVAPSALPVTISLPLTAPLRSGQSYRVSLRGIPTNVLIDPSDVVTSEPVKGLPDKLFETILISATPSALKFTPIGSSEPIKLVVVTSMNGDTLTRDCPSPAQCEVPVSDLPKPPPTPQTTNTAPAAPSGQAQLTFKVTATTTDNSERSQSDTYALGLGAPASSPSTASATTKSRVQDFVTGLTTANKQSSGIQAQQIKGSSVATFVAVFLKAFFGI